MLRTMARRCIIGGLLALPPVNHAAAQQPIQSQLVVPPDLQLAIMIKTALVAFNHANLSGNYAVLRDLAAPSFREANSTARLAEIFAKPRKEKLNIAPIVLFQPKLVRKPWINDRRLLRLKGFFATRPKQVNFNLAFQAVAGQWRLFAIGVTASVPKVTGKTPAKAKPVKKKAAAGGQPARRPDPAAPKAGRAVKAVAAPTPPKKPAPVEPVAKKEPPPPPKKKQGSSWWKLGN